MGKNQKAKCKIPPTPFNKGGVRGISLAKDIPVRLDMRELLGRQAMSGCAVPRPKIATLLSELLARVQEQKLLEPAIAWETFETVEISQLLPSRLSSARKLAVSVCTIGAKLERAVSSYFSKSEPLRGLLLDGIGNAALDIVVRGACRLIRDEASLQGYGITNPISPGIPGFSLSDQQALLKLLPVEKVGVSITASGMMAPLKSISMAMGLFLNLLPHY